MISIPNFALFRLDAVATMRAWFATVSPLIQRLPKGRGGLGDQASRSALSAYLNLVEGAAMPPGDGRKASQFAVAMGSLSEAVACIDAAMLLGLIAEEQGAEVQRMAEAAARLLGGLLRSVRPHSNRSSRSSRASTSSHRASST